MLMQDDNLIEDFVPSCKPFELTVSTIFLRSQIKQSWLLLSEVLACTLCSGPYIPIKLR